MIAYPSGGVLQEAQEARMRLLLHLCPEEKKVTICIAAECRVKGTNCIVICSDFRAGSSLGYSDTMLKQRWLPGGYRLLTAGDDTEINAGLRLLWRRFLSIKEDANETELKIAVEEALFALKKEKTETHIRGRYAIGYDEFIKHGRERFPPTYFSRK